MVSVAKDFSSCLFWSNDKAQDSSLNIFQFMSLTSNHNQSGISKVITGAMVCSTFFLFFLAKILQDEKLKMETWKHLLDGGKDVGGDG